MTTFRPPGGSLFRPKRPKFDPIPARTDEDIAREAAERTRALRKRRGRGTILTDDEDLGNPVLTRPAASRSTLGV